MANGLFLNSKPNKNQQSSLFETPPFQPKPVMDAAQLLGGALAGNPFITGGGLSQLEAGRAPLLSQIDPTLLSATSPTIIEALLGLYSAIGMRPEDVQHTLQQFTPVGLPY